MKILLVSLNYYPELTGIGKYTGELAAWLAMRGHDVRVVTSPPYYPDWQIDANYSSFFYRRETIEKVDVFRCPLWVPRHPSGFKRLLHLTSFSLSSLPAMLWQIFWRPSFVWVVAPAFFSAPGAWLTARLCGVPAWLHVQDYEVDAAFDLGLLRGAWLKKIVLGVESWLFRSFDVVSTISFRMLTRAQSKGVVKDRALLFPNWVDISTIHPELSGSTYRAQLTIPNDRVVALYSGNMGGKQGLEILADVARLLVGNHNVFFVFCGNGSGRALLEELCLGLKNVLFLDLQPLERLGELLALADIHLLPQRADAADLVMPSKLTGMLASGRPVIATAHKDTEVAKVIKECGVVVPPESPQAFATAVANLADDSQTRRIFGANARKYAEENLDKEAVLRRFEAQIIHLGGMEQK